MRNERLTEEQKKEIIELKSTGMKVSDIASKLNLSVSGVYRVLDKSNEIQDSDLISELKKKISSLEEDNRRLLSIIETLVKKQN